MTLFRILLTVAILATTGAHAERKVVQALTDTDPLLDPVYSSDTTVPVIINSLFDTLITWDAAGELAPAQAERWSISADGLVYTFHLSDQNYWTDGEPVIAEDFVTAFRRVVDPATDERIVMRYLLDPVENAMAITKGEMAPDMLGVRAIDASTFEIRLTAPTSYFPEVLAQTALSAVPTHALKRLREGWADPENLISNGPYRLEMAEPGRMVVLRNETYPGRPEPDRLEFRFAKDPAELMRLMASDEVDIVLTLPQKEVAALQNRNWVKRFTVEASSATTYLSLNMTKEPFSDLKVRQAIDLVIDREVLNRAQNDYTGVPATTFTSPTLFIYDKPPARQPLQPYPERLAKARKLLEEAGYDDKNPLQVRLVRRSASPQSQPAFVGIRSMLGQLPIRLETAELDRTELLKRLSEKDFEAAILTWQADYNDPMTFLSLFRTGGFANFSGWTNARYQSLLDKALATSDRHQREDLYLQLEGLIRDDLPIIPLRHSSLSVVWSADISLPVLVNGIIYPRLVRFVDQ